MPFEKRRSIAKERYQLYMKGARGALEEYRNDKDPYWLYSAEYNRIKALEWYARYRRYCAKIC